MGVRGIARDLAAAGLGTLKPLDVPQIEGGFDNPVEVRIEDPEGCPAFYGRTVRGLTNGASPDWMQRRLKAAGQRPISALVDITNYVMLDLGRPAHAYDLRELKGAVSARRARDGEKVLALNEKEYVLDSSMTVIADEAQVHANISRTGPSTSSSLYPAMRSGSATLSNADRCRIRRKSWNTTPMRRR